jgi:hypothetical protein
VQGQSIIDVNKGDSSVARMPRLLLLIGWLPAIIMAVGCESDSHTENGALFGGLLGAGTGALIGAATGHAAAGAAIGAGVGALSGAAIGNSQDEMEARNRALIAQQLGRQVSATAVTPNDIIAMTKAGVKDELIINHIRAHGLAAPLQSNDLIGMQQQGVSPRVVAVMQSTPVAQAPQTVVVQPQPVIVEEYPDYYGPRVYVGPPRHYYRSW